MSSGLPGAGKEDELDKVLHELQIDKSICADKSCKKNVILLGQVCKLCKFKFCLSHGLPEAHGCGADAKKAARKDWLKTDGNTKPQISAQGSSKDWHRPYLAKKLKDQVDQKSLERRKGATEGKAKKCCKGLLSAMSDKPGAKSNEFAGTKLESGPMKVEAASQASTKPAAPGLSAPLASVWSGCCPRQRGGGWSTAYLELQKSLIQQGKQS